MLNAIIQSSLITGNVQVSRMEGKHWRRIHWMEEPKIFKFNLNYSLFHKNIMFNSPVSVLFSVSNSISCLPENKQTCPDTWTLLRSFVDQFYRKCRNTSNSLRSDTVLRAWKHDKQINIYVFFHFNFVWILSEIHLVVGIVALLKDYMGFSSFGQSSIHN